MECEVELVANPFASVICRTACPLPVAQVGSKGLGVLMIRSMELFLSSDVDVTFSWLVTHPCQFSQFSILRPLLSDRGHGCIICQLASICWKDHWISLACIFQVYIQRHRYWDCTHQLPMAGPGEFVLSCWWTFVSLCSCPCRSNSSSFPEF